MPENTHAVVLGVDGESELLALAERLTRFAIPYKIIREPDPPFLGAAMAIGVYPQRRSSQTKKALGGLRTMGEVK